MKKNNEDFMKPITCEEILEGLRKGVVRITTNSESCKETVASIGDDWFYFAGIEGEEQSPEEYRAGVPDEEIAEEICDVLESFRTDIDEDGEINAEWGYCRAYLDENLARREAAS